MSDRKSNFYLLLGNNIARLRKQSNKNQEELANFLKLSRATIVNVEKGRHHPNAFQLWEICQFLNVTTDSIMPTNEDVSRFEDKPIILPSNLEKEFSTSTIADLKKFIENI
jgi:transcriptional regulator with XRE-family HTH domain